MAGYFCNIESGETVRIAPNSFTIEHMSKDICPE